MSKKRSLKSRRRSAKRRQRGKQLQNGGRTKDNLSFEQLEARHLLATFVVNSNADLPVDLTDSVVTLRDAIQAANDDVAVSPGGVVGGGDDTITFDSSVFSGAAASLVRLTQGELVITDSLTIEGSTGVDVTITGDANGDDIVDAFNITDVEASFGGTLGLASDLLDDNSRVLNTSGGTTTLRNLTITGGRTIDYAGDEVFDTEGGGIRVTGALQLENTSVSGNSTYGGLGGGGIYSFFGVLSLTGSTVSGNSAMGAQASGGGIRSIDLFFVPSTSVYITNSTVSGNVASGYGGGIAAGINGGINLTNSTVTNNEARYGGGLALHYGEYSTIANSIVAGNLADFAPDISGAGHSHVGPARVYNSLIGEGYFSDRGGNQVGLDPRLGPLADNGGLTMTHALLRGSPAIDAGDPAFDVSGPDGILGTADDVLFDQRGAGFDRVAGIGLDLGAVERQPAVDTFVPESVTVIRETLSEFDLSSVEIAAGNGGQVTVTLSASSGVFESPTHGQGVTADLLSPGVIELVGTPLDIDIYLNDTSNIQYTAATGVFGEAAATLTVAVDSVLAGVTDINVAEISALVVNTSVDADNPFDALTSLREAIAFANSSDRPGTDTITFDASVFTGGNASLIRLTQGELEITESINIDGSTVGGVTITGDANDDDVTDAANITDVAASFGGTVGAADDLLDDNSRVLYISTGTGDSTLLDLVITGGRTTGDSDDGAGILFRSSGRLTLTDSSVSGNSSTGRFSDGGGISAGRLTLTNSTVSGNVSHRAGGVNGGFVTLINSSVVGNLASRTSGGGIAATEVSLINSVVSENSAVSRGGGISLVGVGESATLINSTVSGNSTTGEFGQGGGIYTGDGEVRLSNSTVSGNRTLGTDSNGGGIFISGGFSSGLISVRNSTITANEASGLGGGIYASVNNSGRTADITIENSIVAGNTDSGTAPDLSPEPIGGLQINHSLIGAADDLGFIAGNFGNQIGTVGNPIDPLLGPLADNGGPTMTHALLVGSPAIHAGDPAFDVNGPDGMAGTDDVLFDQRGIGFERVVGGRLDIGAFESELGQNSLVVTTTDDIVADDGEVSLREAIAFANSAESPGADTITFAQSVFNGGTNRLIRLTQGELEITETLTIDGSTFGVTITGDANGDDIILAGGVTDATATFGSEAGGGEDLLDDNSRVILFSGQTGDLTLEGVTITGGHTTGILTGGGGILFQSEGDLTLRRSLVSGNSTSGFVSNGGGIYTYFGQLTLDNSTVSGNAVLGVSSNGGGILTGTNSVTLLNSTVTGNQAISGVGGGLLVFNSPESPALTIENSIVAGNTDNGTAPDLRPSPSGSVEGNVEINHSLIGAADNLGAIGGNVGNQLGTFVSPIDPFLGPLADNGGLTMTHALLEGSPAINSADPAFDLNGSDGIAGTDDDATFDQRGFGFDRLLGGRLDIGALESLVGTPAPKIVSADIDEGGLLIRPDLWRTLTVVFDKRVSITADALSLTNDTLGGTAVDLSQVAFDYDPSTFTATWTFDTSAPLPFAFYTYTLAASSITAGGLSLDGDGDGTAGDNFVAEHYVALPGDTNLDGMVDVLIDAFAMVANLGLSGRSWAQGDFNGDGTVDVLGDAFPLVASLGLSVIPPSAASAAGSLAQTKTAPVAASALAVSPFEVEQEDKDKKQVGVQQPEIEPTSSLELAGHQTRDLAFESDLASDLLIG